MLFLIIRVQNKEQELSYEPTTSHKKDKLLSGHCQKSEFAWGNDNVRKSKGI